MIFRWPVGRVFVVAVVFLAFCGRALAGEPWIVTEPVTITAPAELGTVFVTGGGVLRVVDVGEPGVRFSGNVIAVDGGRIVFERSVIRFMSTYNGQYALVAWSGGEVTVRDCDYRVPAGVQHGIVSGEDGHVLLEDGDFGFVQLVPAGDSIFEARRLDGTFEVIVQDRAVATLEDIPREPGGGALWVWPEFPAGSVAVWSPPLPGFVEAWSFPPESSSGIEQSIQLLRCAVELWPILVRSGCDLTLRDIAAENWTVVGLHLPHSLEVAGLVNQDPETTRVLPLDDRTVRLENASIDTWNLYPENGARIDVRDSVLGEVLASGTARVRMERSVVDGTGGFLGAMDHSEMTLVASTVTCDVQAAGDALLTLRDSTVRPPEPFSGAALRLGAFDRARLLLAQSAVEGVEAGRVVTLLGGRGLIALAALDPPPAAAPAPGESLRLRGWASLYSLDPAVAAIRWRLSLRRACGLDEPIGLGAGEANVEGGTLGWWDGTDETSPWRLELGLTDGLGRPMAVRWTVPDPEGDLCARPPAVGRVPLR